MMIDSCIPLYEDVIEPVEMIYGENIKS